MFNIQKKLLKVGLLLAVMGNTFQVAFAHENKATGSTDAKRLENMESEIKYLRERVDKLQAETAKASDISRLDTQLDKLIPRTEFDNIKSFAWGSIVLAIFISVWVALHAAVNNNSQGFPSPPSGIMNFIPSASPYPQPTPSSENSN